MGDEDSVAACETAPLSPRLPLEVLERILHMACLANFSPNLKLRNDEPKWSGERCRNVAVVHDSYTGKANDTKLTSVLAYLLMSNVFLPLVEKLMYSQIEVTLGSGAFVGLAAVLRRRPSMSVYVQRMTIHQSLKRPTPFLPGSSSRIMQPQPEYHLADVSAIFSVCKPNNLELHLFETWTQNPFFDLLARCAGTLVDLVLEPRIFPLDLDDFTPDMVPYCRNIKSLAAFGLISQCVRPDLGEIREAPRCFTTFVTIFMLKHASILQRCDTRLCRDALKRTGLRRAGHLFFQLRTVLSGISEIVGCTDAYNFLAAPALQNWQIVPRKGGQKLDELTRFLSELECRLRFPGNFIALTRLNLEMFAIGGKLSIRKVDEQDHTQCREAFKALQTRCEQRGVALVL